MDSTLIHQITLPTPFPVGDVHVYLINDDMKVLVDCGCKTEKDYNRLQQRLNEIGFSFDDIDQLWLTHSHPDHSGLAARLQKEHSVKVGIHQTELRYMQKNQFIDRFGEWFRKHQVPEHLIQAMDGGRVWYQSYYDNLRPDFLVKDKQKLSTGNNTFTVHHLPGHAPGHVAFISNGSIISGDVLLEKITSNAILTFEHDTPKRVRSLCQQRDSLEFMKNLDGTVYPGHGNTFDNPREVAEAHLNSHEVRYTQVVNAVKLGEGSLFEITKRVLPQVEQPAITFLCLSEVIGFLDLSIDRKDVDFDSDLNVFVKL